MYHGIMNVYKEAGMTSFDVVACLRKICGQKKIGHTGTLDPEASGVLPVCLGKATKVCDLLTDRDKEYQTVLRLGLVTDTQDTTGRVIQTGDPSGLTEARIRQTVQAFLGEQDQIPPMYSAKKVDGKRLYELAREGITVARKPARITVHEIEIQDICLSGPDAGIKLRIACSKGTYIRTLCHDIGQSLGCGGAMASLVRTRAAGYRIEDARRLDQIRALADRSPQALQAILQPIDRVFSDLPGVRTAPAFDRALQNGSKLPEQALCPEEASDLLSGGDFRLYTSDGLFAGLYYYSPEEALFRVRKLFLLNTFDR